MRLRVCHLAATLFCLTALGQPPVSAMRLDGQRVALLPPHARGAVLFFVATDCPISNRYQPEMQRLEREFTPRGMAFWFVYPNLTETAVGIRAHRTDFAEADGAAHVLLDPDLRLTRLAGARVTPEAAILLAGKGDLRPVYMGRIDDRYVSIGNERPRATRHDLEDSIAAALPGRPVPPPGGPSVGCGIVSVR